MLDVLVVLVVLKEQVIFVGGIFGRVQSPNFFGGEIIESIKKICGPKKSKYL